VTNVEVPLNAIEPLGAQPAEEHVAGRLDQPMALDDAFGVVA